MWPIQACQQCLVCKVFLSFYRFTTPLSFFKSQQICRETSNPTDRPSPFLLQPPKTRPFVQFLENRHKNLLRISSTQVWRCSSMFDKFHSRSLKDPSVPLTTPDSSVTKSHEQAKESQRAMCAQSNTEASYLLLCKGKSAFVWVLFL